MGGFQFTNFQQVCGRLASKIGFARPRPRNPLVIAFEGVAVVWGGGGQSLGALGLGAGWGWVLLFLHTRLIMLNTSIFGTCTKRGGDSVNAKTASTLILWGFFFLSFLLQSEILSLF